MRGWTNLQLKTIDTERTALAPLQIADEIGGRMELAQYLGSIRGAISVGLHTGQRGGNTQHFDDDTVISSSYQTHLKSHMSTSKFHCTSTSACVLYRRSCTEDETADGFVAILDLLVEYIVDF
jgi:hypothetical protein